MPNSNLATVGSQFDPKDVDYLESERGGLAANYGDRAYGVFNVVPRSGFESDRFGDTTARVGNYNQASVYSSFGNHTTDQKFAWFASGSGSRTDRGLERVDIPVIHDNSSAFSGFTSVLYNPSTTNQFRLVVSTSRRHAVVTPITSAPTRSQSTMTRCSVCSRTSAIGWH